MLALKKSRGMFGYVAVLLLMVLTISMLFTNGFGSNIRDRRITYPQLLTMIEEGQVRSVAIRGTSLVGVTTTTTVADADFPDKNYDFETTIGADFIVTARQMQAAKLNKPLDEVSVKDLAFTIIYRQPLTTPWWYDLIPLAISLVLCGVMFWLIMRAQTGGNGKVMNFGRSRARIHDPNKNKVTFADVAGAEEEKEELKEMVDFLRNPKAYIDMGAGFNIPIMRVADVILMLAEVKAGLDADTEAIGLVNQIRERAFGDDLHNISGLSGEALKEAILMERKFELFGEGHTSYDLVRSGKFSQKAMEVRNEMSTLAENLKTKGYHEFENGNILPAYIWTKQVAN